MNCALVDFLTHNSSQAPAFFYKDNFSSRITDQAINRCSIDELPRTKIDVELSS